MSAQFGQIGSLVLLLLALFPYSPAEGSVPLYVEDFTTTQYCDTLNTTCWWDTQAGEIKLPPFELQLVGSCDTPTDAREVAIHGDYAFVAEWGHPALLVMDISDPTNPTQVASLDLPDAAAGLTISGNYLYIADVYAGGLQVVDITVPAVPTPVGSYITPDPCRDVAVDGDYAYVAFGFGGLHVLDVSDPANPTLLGRCYAHDHQYVFNVSFAGDYVFVSVEYYGLDVIDVSDPTNPFLVGGYNPPFAHGCGHAVWGDHIYFTGGYDDPQMDDLIILDISDPINPVPVGVYDTPGRCCAQGVGVSGDHVYVFDRVGDTTELLVIDVSDPTSPTLLASYDTNAMVVSNITIFGDYAYLGAGEAGVQVVRIAEPVLPPMLGGSYETLDQARIAAIVGDYAYVADQGFGLQVLDISDPLNPTLAGSWAAPSIATGVAIAGDYAYVTDADFGLQAIDISDPTNPTLAGSCDTPHCAHFVAIAGNHAYVADDHSGLQVIDISDPTNPTPAGSCDTPGRATTVTTAGNYAYVGDYWSLQVIDISDPTNPTVAGSLGMPMYTTAPGIAGDYAFVANGPAGLLVVDISDPTNPTLAGSCDAPEWATGAAIAGDYASVSDEHFGLLVLDISDPTSPTLAGGYDTLGHPRWVTIAGDYAYVADWEGGLQVIEIFQRRFDTLSNVAQSLSIDESEHTIRLGRLTTTQVEAISWELSADGGAYWEELLPGDTWHTFSSPGSDLLWRSTHVYAGRRNNPSCSHLEIEWLHACTLAVSPARIVTYYPCGGSYSLDLSVRNVPDLGAFEVCSGYDNSLVEYEEVVVDSAFLGSTGRSIYPLDPVWCDPACHIAGIRYGAYSAGEEPGPFGDGPLARIFFSRLVDGAAEDWVCLEDWELVNTQIPPGLIEVDEAAGADIIHRSFCYGDFNDDGDVTVIDIMQVAGRWGCCVGEECYVDTFDVNLVEPGNYCASIEDGCIDIVDVQEVAGRWGLGCPGALMAHLLPADLAPTVRVWPESLEVCCSVGDTASFAIVIEDAHDLGAFELALAFDANVIHVEDVFVGSLLGSTGRSVYPLGPRIDNESGSVSFGAWTTGDSLGAEGSGTLVRVVVSMESCNQTTDLDITKATVTYTHGWPQTLAGVFGGWVETVCPARAPELIPRLPVDYVLYPNQPNPLSLSTVISFAVPGSSENKVPIELVIYDISGRVVCRLGRGEYEPGYHTVVWNGRDEGGAEVRSGVYFCQLRSKGEIRTSRMVRIR